MTMKTSPIASTWWLGLGLAALTSLWFAAGVRSDRSFVDEWAYLSQAYFADLFASGLHNDPAWLEYPGYDLPPLPKYQIGAALRIAGLPRPSHEMMVRWYRDTSTKTGTEAMLMAARWPSVLWGGIGCSMIYAIGVQVSGRRLGILAAFLLTINPLYRLHARRAMSDVPAEALILCTLAFGLWAWNRRRDGMSLGLTCFTSTIIGILGGLAVLTKLNGALALMTIGVWSVWDIAIHWRSRFHRLPQVGPDQYSSDQGIGEHWSTTSSSTPNERISTPIHRLDINAALCSLVALAIAGLTGFATFVLLNPFMTAKPTGALPQGIAEIAAQNLIGRARIVFEHRAAASTQGAKQFPHNALTTLDQKLAAVIVQGYGRFGPLGPSHTDSTKRFDLAQDWGALLWIPLLLMGFVVLVIRARRSPVSGAVVLMTGLTFVVVTGFIPLAWDRYYLSIQPGAALFGASAVDWIVELFWSGRTVGQTSGRSAHLGRL